MDFTDYLDELNYENAVRDEELRASSLSSLWSRKKRKRDKANEVVYELMRIRDTVRNIVKIHGVPRNTTVSLQTMGAHGLSGYAGKDKTKPFIYLSKAIYDMVPVDDIVDVYCGVGLHEASHLNHTKLMFDRMLRGELKFGTPRAVWEGLLEDERIERFVKEESAGYFPFIQKAKKALYEGKELGGMLKEWESAPDIHKFNALIFCFIRMPHLLKKKHRQFKLIDGDCVYETLKTIITKIPTTELEIAMIGLKLEEYYNKVLELYKKLAGTPDDSVKDDFKSFIDAMIDGLLEEAKSHSVDEKGEPKELTPEEEEKLKKEVLTKFRVIKIKHDGTFTEDKEYSDMLSKLLTDMDRTAAKPGDDIKAVTEDAAKRTDKKIKDIKETVKELEEYRIKHGKFSLDDLGRMVERIKDKFSSLSKEEELELAKAEDERIEFYEDTRSETRAVSSCVIHPKATPEAVKQYKAIYELVRNDVLKMRKVFAFRLGDRQHNVNELVEGKLHRRMLSKLDVTNRIFHTSYTKRDKGLALCLLLDESGSMGYATPGDGTGAATNASKIAVLIAEALKNVPYTELEIYSYSSYDSDQNNLIKYLYGKSNKDIHCIGNYYRGNQNYDHAAISVAGKLFKENTTHEKKVMIVVSDGNPQGNSYGGVEAQMAVKKEVDKLERTGMYVMQIAITNSVSSSNMFKHWIRFTDIPNLTNKIRTIITGMIRAST